MSAVINVNMFFHQLNKAFDVESTHFCLSWYFEFELFKMMSRPVPTSATWPVCAALRRGQLRRKTTAQRYRPATAPRRASRSPRCSAGARGMFGTDAWTNIIITIITSMTGYTVMTASFDPVDHRKHYWIIASWCKIIYSYDQMTNRRTKDNLRNRVI